MTLEELQAALEALHKKAEEAVASNATAEEAKALIDELKPQIEELTAAKKEVEAVEERKALTAKLEDLQSAMAELRKPSGNFVLPTEEESKGLASDDPYADGKHSMFNDIRLATKGNSEAIERVNFNVQLPDSSFRLNEEGKAMTEGTQAQGGYLVRPQVERQLVLAREQDNVLRGLCSSINLTTNQISLDQLGLTTSAGWVAELATKPESTGMTLANITANVFTAAGLVTVSNQLLADSNPAVDGLVTADLAKRLVAVEETAFLAGTGSGQPLGLLNTPGLGATAVTATDIPSILEAVLDAIASVQSNHDSPTAILMHPRTWTAILKAKDVQGAYYVDPTGGPQDPRTGLRGPSKILWGVPVLTTNRMPVTLGGGTESRIIVGDFKEALILDRQGITLDVSPHVLFTSNQTIFRSEMRVGFTAARTPAAFNVVGGAGLAGK